MNNIDQGGEGLINLNSVYSKRTNLYNKQHQFIIKEQARFRQTHCSCHLETQIMDERNFHVD